MWTLTIIIILILAFLGAITKDEDDTEDNRPFTKRFLASLFLVILFLIVVVIVVGLFLLAGMVLLMLFGGAVWIGTHCP